MLTTRNKNLLSVLFLTTLGSSMASVAAFFSIQSIFHNTAYLALSLSLRTLSTALFSYKANGIIKRFGNDRCYRYAQILEIFAAFFLCVGLYLQNFTIFLLAIMIIGIPLNLTNILLTIDYKNDTFNEHSFRQMSGLRELTVGIARFIACIITPFLLLYFGLNKLLFISILCAGLCLIIFLNIQHKVSSNLDNEQKIKINLEVFNYRSTWVTFIKMTSAYILVAFIAIIASSKNVVFTYNIPETHRESLWALEALMMIAASALYIRFKSYCNNKCLDYILVLNSFPLLGLLYSTNTLMLTLVICASSLLIAISFYKYRDDLVLSANDNKQLIETYSSMAYVVKDLLCTVSPFIMSYIFTQFTTILAVAFLLIIQIVLLGLIKLIETGLFNQYFAPVIKTSLSNEIQN